MKKELYIASKSGAVIAILMILSSCFSIPSNMLRRDMTEYCNVRVINQTNEDVVLYGQSGGEVGKSSISTITLQRGSQVSAVGKKSGTNYGTIIVMDNTQEWYLH